MIFVSSDLLLLSSIGDMVRCILLMSFVCRYWWIVDMLLLMCMFWFVVVVLVCFSVVLMLLVMKWKVVLFVIFSGGCVWWVSMKIGMW